MRRPPADRPGTRPRSVTAIAYLFVAAGVFGLAYHAADIDPRGPFDYRLAWVLVVRLLAIVAGVFLLRGANWARWLAIAWIGYHVALSALHSWVDTAVHAVLLAGIAYVLLRPPVAAFFRGARR